MPNVPSSCRPSGFPTRRGEARRSPRHARILPSRGGPRHTDLEIVSATPAARCRRRGARKIGTSACGPLKRTSRTQFGLGHTGDTPGGMNSDPQFGQRKPLAGELAGMLCSAARRPDEASPKVRETDLPVHGSNSGCLHLQHAGRSTMRGYPFPLPAFCRVSAQREVSPLFRTHSTGGTRPNVTVAG